MNFVFCGVRKNVSFCLKYRFFKNTMESLIVEFKGRRIIWRRFSVLSERDWSKKRCPGP